LKFQIENEAGNRAIKGGSLAKTIERLMELMHPEPAYFGTDDGVRTGFVVFDMKDSSQMPIIGEQLFMNLNAKIFIAPIMNEDDLKKGLSDI
jgi:pantothenate synthetase